MPSSSDCFAFTESFQTKVLAIHFGDGDDDREVISVPVPSAGVNPAWSWE